MLAANSVTYVWTTSTMKVQLLLKIMTEVSSTEISLETPRGQTSSLQVRVQNLEDVNVYQHPLIRCLINFGVQEYGSVENEPSPHLYCGTLTERIVA